mmetsp:Transcript_35690/g.43033  ORF Transcript_35690/g.43033 Transcript_35690/m.43033 type:complete len:126 (-) Transcript_35690:301-678(-)|eukprot:CAMPEP_0197864646 /NCGR_PEP_ID=MMETSP1438-20131217/43023_1 /TAXON_ID=1461541 /ORGANISM="Pterosperma sp., Strain CCMP1384" /LENGTH=125 /DNA_ID=CAMNT_0043482967 /DNA_START=157 /DNA_END=534 /DNA_ORIENTATION=+
MGLSDEELIEKVTEYFFMNDEFANKFEQWTVDNCDCFTDDEENKLEYTALHQKFAEMFEELMGAHLVSLGSSVEAFAEVCQKAEGTDNAELAEGARSIVEVMTTLTDFDSFCQEMKRQAAKKRGS